MFPKVPGRTFSPNPSKFITFAAAPLALTLFVRAQDAAFRAVLPPQVPLIIIMQLMITKIILIVVMLVIIIVMILMLVILVLIVIIVMIVILVLVLVLVLVIVIVIVIVIIVMLVRRVMPQVPSPQPRCRF